MIGEYYSYFVFKIIIEKNIDQINYFKTHNCLFLTSNSLINT